MDKVHSLEGAREWFATHTGAHPGSVECVKVGEDGAVQGNAVCSTVEDAEKFYGGQTEPAPAAEVAETAPAETPAAEAVSPVADMTAHDAIEHIGRMRSADKLQAIAVSETRTTVAEAAKARLAAVSGDDKSDEPAE